jgi:class 3 adenylate cyclase
VISDQEVEEVVTRMLSRVPDVDLRTGRRWEAPEYLRQLLNRAFRVMSEDLQLPRSVTLIFVDVPGETRGQAWHEPGARFSIVLNRAEIFDNAQFLEVLAHEAQHISDQYTRVWADFDRADLERRAIRFANWFMQSRVTW